MRGAGNYYLIFIGLLLCAAGAAFAWLMWRSFDRAADQRAWKEVPCEILEARVAERQIGRDVHPEFRFAVLYGYVFDGASYTSDRYSLRGSPWSSSLERATELAENYPAGSQQLCHVDPARPDFAVLKLDSKAPGYSLWFPLIFVIGGLGIILSALRSLLR